MTIPAEANQRGPVTDLAAVAEVLARGDAVVLTGAGISTDSGIPDYRGADGVRRVMPMQYGEFIATSAARRRYWARSYVGWQRFRAAEPNAGHHEVARMQAAGLIQALITQNVDGLHQAAGSEQVVELHGSLAQVGCLSCRALWPRTAVQQAMDAANPGFTAYLLGVVGDGSQVSSQIRPDGDVVLPDDVIDGFVVPTCPRCGADTLKPDVVFFGEAVPKPRVEYCINAVAEARSLVVVGSSLAVMSGYRFVRQAAAQGTQVAILTRGATRGDEQAAYKIDAAISPTLSALTEALGLNR